MGLVRARLSLSCLLLLAPACVDFPDLGEAACGDGFLDEDRGEDCDGDSIDLDGRTYECRSDCRISCVPSIASFCDATLLGSATAGCCPPGWGCGVDEICREPSGKFARLDSVEADVTRLSTADFDGDGLEDILAIGASELAVHYLDEDRLSQALRVSLTDQAITFGDVILDGADTGDARQDLALKVGIGVGVLRGEEEHGFTPMVYPVPLLAGAEALRTGGKMILADMNTDDGDPSDSVFIVTKDRVIPIPDDEDTLPLPGKAYPNLPVAAGDILPGNGCEELIIPLDHNGKPAITLIQPCDPSAPPVIEVLGDTGEVVGPVHVVDIDKNVSLDVAITVTGSVNTGLGTEIRVYRENGGMLVKGPVAAVTSLAGPKICDAGSNPLAVGDLDGDCLPDYVDPCRVVISGVAIPQGADCALVGAARTDIPFYNTGEPWDLAIIRDFNGDGLSDVMAASQNGSALSFFRGTGQPYLNPSSIAAGVEIGQILPGDFDGDGITDLAILERTDIKSESAILVAFGSYLGSPSLPVKLGDVPGGQQIVAGEYRPLSISIDGMTDLGVVSFPPEEEGGAALAFFAGDASRRMQSTVGLTNDLAVSGDVPKQLAFGYFHSEHTRELAALALATDPFRSRLWRLPAFGESAPGVMGAAPVPSRPDLELPGLVAVTAQVARIRGEGGLDWLAIVGSSEETGEDHPAQSQLWLARAASGRWEIAAGPHRLGAKLAPAGLVVADIDNNGLDDLSMVVDGIEGRDLKVWWDVVESLPAADPSQEPPWVSIGACSSPGTPVNSVAWAVLDEDLPLEGIILTGDGACRVDIDVDPGCPECRPRVEKQQVTVEGEHDIGVPVPGGGAPATLRGTAITLGDVNGDGLLDVITGEAGSYQVFLAQAANP